MLIDILKKTYREMARNVKPANPLITVSTSQPAANASSFKKADMQARRHRRERRLERAGRHRISGWTVRAW